MLEHDQHDHALGSRSSRHGRAAQGVAQADLSRRPDRLRHGRSRWRLHRPQPLGGGAKIMFSDRAVVPTEFELTIAQKRETVRARIVWRHADMAGVALYPG